jgi:predicted nuclease of predicted toxin-antitoxin system
VKLLIDESLQHSLAHTLTKAGHDVVHVVDLGLQGAPDVEVLAAAAVADRTLVTADTDFGTLLALSNASGPSVVLLRRPGRRVTERAEVVLAVLESVEAQLARGAVVTVERSRLRVRELPIRPHS